MVETRAVGEIDELIGMRVRARRLAIDMSQEVLADKLGITFQQVQKYEKGVNRIAASRLLGICDALSVTVSWMMQDLQQAGAEDVGHARLKKVLATEEGAALLELFCQIESKALRRQLVQLARVLVTGS